MDKYNLQIIPPDSGKVRQLRVTGKRLSLTFFAIGLFVLLNLLAFGTNLFFALDAKKEADIAATNEKLADRLGIMTARAESLESMMAEITELNGRILDLADIPPIDGAELSYGIGGPQLGFLDPDEPAVLWNARDIDRKLDSLIIAAQAEKKALLDAGEAFEKKVSLFEHTPTIWPMKGYISSGFGKRSDPFTGTWKMHEGIDICARRGTPVRATADGRVKFTGWYHGYGKTVRVNHIYYETRYAHLDDINVYEGQQVERGDIIGTCGSTGYSTGVHLHYEVRISGRPVDPKKYLFPDVVVD